MLIFYQSFLFSVCRTNQLKLSATNKEKKWKWLYKFSYSIPGGRGKCSLCEPSEWAPNAAAEQGTAATGFKQPVPSEPVGLEEQHSWAAVCQHKGLGAAAATSAQHCSLFQGRLSSVCKANWTESRSQGAECRRSRQAEKLTEEKWKPVLVGCQPRTQEQTQHRTHVAVCTCSYCHSTSCFTRGMSCFVGSKKSTVQFLHIQSFHVYCTFVPKLKHNHTQGFEKYGCFPSER